MRLPWLELPVNQGLLRRVGETEKLGVVRGRILVT